eukprot:TRINITY_DN38263_c0_g1_i3.p1 TRINITY_DN38263_c0_g1~~TRINITY_DN38263_c0_g1_i3.p1  ORF type:complete len:448 (-),score=106.58 TRINITY_DN38263_c0_g1_i3:4-1347(-)
MAGELEEKELAALQACCARLQQGDGGGNATTPKADPDEPRLYCNEDTCSSLASLTGLARGKHCCRIQDGFMVGKFLNESTVAMPGSTAEEPNLVVHRRSPERRRPVVRREQGPEEARQGHHRVAAQLSLAVSLTGLTSRLILKSAVEQVVQPSVQTHSVQVDFFVDLVQIEASKTHFHLKTLQRFVKDPDVPEDGASIYEYIRSSVSQAGGELVYYRHADKDEKIQPVPAWTKKRFMAYSPCCTSAGLGVLRRFQQMQRNWGEIKAYEERSGGKYDYVLATREDQHWSWPLDLRSFAAREAAAAARRCGAGVDGAAGKAAEVQRQCADEPTMYMKACRLWGSGFSDKVMLLNRAAAERFLGSLYSSYFKKEEATTEMNTTGGAESYQAAYARHVGVKYVHADFRQLSALDAQYAHFHSGVHLCLKDYYVGDCHPIASGLRTCLTEWR